MSNVIRFKNSYRIELGCPIIFKTHFTKEKFLSCCTCLIQYNLSVIAYIYISFISCLKELLLCLVLSLQLCFNSHQIFRFTKIFSFFLNIYDAKRFSQANLVCCCIIIIIIITKRDCKDIIASEHLKHLNPFYYITNTKFTVKSTFFSDFSLNITELFLCAEKMSCD